MSSTCRHGLGFEYRQSSRELLLDGAIGRRTRETGDVRSERAKGGEAKYKPDCWQPRVTANHHAGSNPAPAIMSESLETKVDTGGDDVHHPYTAFNQGFDAFDEGYPKECNPYEGDLGAWWDSGWDEAKEQDDESY